MIIGFDGSRSFVKDKTGTENYAFQLLKELALIDFTNEYIIYLRPGNVVEDWTGPVILNGVKDLKMDEPADSSAMPQNDNYGWPSNFEFKMLNYPRLWTQFGLALQTFKDSLDVLFVPSHTLPLIRNPKLKTVMTVHDLGAEYLPGMHQLKQRLYLGLMTKIQLKTATKLIAVSEATKKDLVSKIGINPNNIEVVYEGLNVISSGSERSQDGKTNLQIPRQARNDNKDNASLSEFEIDKKINDIEKQHQITINNKSIYQKRYFLFVGTIQPRKNLVRLIKAYAGFLNVAKQRNSEIAKQSIYKSDSPIRQSTNSLPALVLAGGKGWLSEEIFELPKKLGIEEQVIFTGRVSDIDLNRLYKNALAFTFPSLFEGFGLPVLEAFEAKVPVITSNNSSLPEVAGDAAILVDPYKTEDIMLALIKLYNDKNAQRDLIKKGSEQLNKFSWKKCASETLAVLKSI